MSRSTRAASQGALAAVTAITAVLMLTSCDKKSLPVLPSDGVVGEPSASQLIVYPDTPARVTYFEDGEVTLVDEVYTTGEGTVQGMVIDFTAADRFELFRQESGVFRLLKDFDLYPVKKLLQGETDIYRFTDPRPQPPGLREYLGRGVVEDVTTTKSPKTNLGRLTIEEVSGTLDYIAPTGIPPDFRPMSDSLLYMEWAPYPGAMGYWVHVYQFTDQSGDEIVRSTIPAPVYVGVTRDYFMAYTPANVTAYKIGDPVPAGMRIVTQRTLFTGQQYFVRVSAVDADGQLIAYTGESEAMITQILSDTESRVFPAGAALVEPRRRPPQPGPVRAIPTANPSISIYPAGTLKLPRH